MHWVQDNARFEGNTRFLSRSEKYTGQQRPGQQHNRQQQSALAATEGVYSQSVQMRCCCLAPLLPSSSAVKHHKTLRC